MNWIILLIELYQTRSVRLLVLPQARSMWDIALAEHIFCLSPTEFFQFILKPLWIRVIGPFTLKFNGFRNFINTDTVETEDALTLWSFHYQSWQTFELPGAIGYWHLRGVPHRPVPSMAIERSFIARHWKDSGISFGKPPIINRETLLILNPTLTSYFA